MTRVFNILILFFVVLLQVHSQQALDFDALNIEDGFASSKATSMIQDRKGFIWVGSWNGLTRYDGYECKIYKPGYKDSSSISNKEIVSLFEDHEGDIWIGTSYGLNCLHTKTGKIRIYPFENRILTIFEDSQNQMWIGTWNDGLYKLDKTTGEKTHFLPNFVVSDILEDSNHEFWVATYLGLIKLDRESGRYKQFLSDGRISNQTICHNTVTQLIESDDGHVWCGTWGGGLSKIISHQNSDSIKFVHYRVRNGEGSMSTNDVYTLYNDQFGNIWIGTWSHGLMRFSSEEQKKEPQQAKFDCYKSEIDNPYSISGDNITALLVDRSGLLWVGSSRIDRSNILNTGFRRFDTSFELDGNNIQNTVKAITTDDDGYLWMGTIHDLRRYIKVDNSYRLIKSIYDLSYNFKGSNYVSSSVLSLLADKDHLWVGTDDAGLLMYNISDFKSEDNVNFIYFNSSTSPSIPGNKVTCIEKSNKYPGVIWIGTMLSGFAKITYLNGNTDIKSYYADDELNSISYNNIRDITEDENGIVWIATQKGLNSFDPETGNFESYFYSRTIKNSINDNVINVLLEDKRGDLWIGTNSGLNKKVIYRDNEGHSTVGFKSYPENEYLRDELITNILEDDSGSIWVSTYMGIIQLNEENEEVVKQYFTKEYQRVGNERKTAYKDKNGCFFIGGSQGYLQFYPNKLVQGGNEPKVCFTDLSIYNKPVVPGTTSGGHKILENTVSYTDSVVLSYRDDVFSVFFSAMDFKDPKKNNYKYILNGYDDEWNDVGTRNSAIYTGVPHGEYILEVFGSDSDGLWSKEPSRLYIRIIPPWWKTNIAYVFYFFILIGLLYFFNKYSVIRVKEKSNLLLEKVKNEKDHELNELKSIFFTNITHEFRTPLTLILGPVEKMLSDNNGSETLKKQIILIQRNATRLLRLVNQLMEFRKVEKGKMELFLQKVNIVPLLVELHDSFKNLADSKRIDLSLHYSHSVIDTWIDLDKFEKVLFNLVSNAFKFTDEGGRISIDAEVVEDESGESVLCIEVEDSGVGIPDDKKELIFERFYQIHQKREQSTGGIGLYLSYAFIQLHRGQILVDSEEGKGSKFKVLLPVDMRDKVKLDENVIIDGQQLQQESTDEKSEPVGILNSYDPKNISEHKGKPKLLLVEDDTDMNEFVAQGLSNDFDIITCFNGKEALKLATEKHPDMIVSDIMMPEMDGLELGKQLRKDLTTSHIPLIFLTAKTLRKDEMEGLRLGAVDYITKPFDLSTLNLKLNNILKTKQNLQEKIRTQMLLQPDEIELTSLDETFLKDVVGAVNKNLDNPVFDVDLLSKEVGMSSNQVYRKIKSLTGQTAKEFIRSQRLKTSANLLLQKKRSISEIIYMVGFSSPSYFTRCFKDQFGCTPSEFIEREGENV